MKKITTYKLPRKLKVSFSSSDKDLGNAQVADLGFIATKKDDKEYFKVYITGGLGKNSLESVELEELIEPKDILYHVEAITNLFIAEGDYSNKNKARTRYIQARMGKEAIKECYKKHLDEIKDKKSLELDVNKKVYNKKGIVTDFKHKRLIEQKQDGLYTVYFHPVGGILELTTLDLIIKNIETVEDVEIRLSMDEGIYIRNLNGNEAKELIKITQDLGGETSLAQSRACIGVPICQIGIGESQSLIREILNYFESKNFTKDVLPSIRISGCNNSCGTHELGILGFAGKKKKINDILTDVFELHVNGRHGILGASLSTKLGEIKRYEIPKFLYELAVEVDKSNKSYEEFVKINKEDFDKIVSKYLV